LTNHEIFREYFTNPLGKGGRKKAWSFEDGLLYYSKKYYPVAKLFDGKNGEFFLINDFHEAPVTIQNLDYLEASAKSVPVKYYLCSVFRNEDGTISFNDLEKIFMDTVKLRTGEIIKNAGSHNYGLNPFYRLNIIRYLSEFAEEIDFHNFRLEDYINEDNLSKEYARKLTLRIERVMADVAYLKFGKTMGVPKKEILKMVRSGNFDSRFLKTAKDVALEIVLEQKNKIDLSDASSPRYNWKNRTNHDVDVRRLVKVVE